MVGVVLDMVGFDCKFFGFAAVYVVIKCESVQFTYLIS